jgi:predicted secreted protein
VLGDGEAKIGAHGKPVLFLHPKDFCGSSSSRRNDAAPGSSRPALALSAIAARPERRTESADTMSLPTSIAIYFIIRWVVLFAVLPWDVRSQQEQGTVTPGSDPGAPAIPSLKRKLLWTTIVAAVVFAIWIAYLDRS